jgi:hypothetical protein
LHGGVLDFIITGIKRKGKRNIPGIFKNLNIYRNLENKKYKCIFEQSAKNYFWAILG